VVQLSWILDYGMSLLESALWYEFIVTYNPWTTLADALHRAGRLPEAEAAFREAEETQKESQPQFPLLYSLWGFRYCDLLLGQGKYQEVQSRAGQTLEWARQAEGVSLLDVALEHLSLGRAHLLQTLPRETGEGWGGGYAQAAAHLNQAVDGLRQAGHQEFIARGLLARAELRRVTGNMAGAQRDLEEALSIATRGGMRLHEADCHLGYARLHLAQADSVGANGRSPLREANIEQAKEHLETAEAMIADMGYHRRDGEVAELEEMLRGTS
jgi:tetratricopeptide (TPR) repeat protein